MKKVLKIIGDVVFGLILVVGLTFLVSLIPIKNNYKVLTVTSGSMEPAIKTGSIILTQPSNSYRIGDVITFHPSNTTSPKNTTTHRIVEINQENGVNIFATKGDANKSNDGALVRQDQVVGKYIFQIPVLGYLLAFIKTLPGLVVIIIIPATIIIYEEFKKITHEAKTITKLKKDRKKELNDVSS